MLLSNAPARRTLLSLLIATVASPVWAGTVSGTLEQWHRVEVRFTGPYVSESDNAPNPFLDYRLQCRFTGPSGQVYDVPGFFDGNGFGDGTGNVWVCRLAPDETGAWSYSAEFRSGSQVAVSAAAAPGSPGWFDGDSGNFWIVSSTKTGRDFRARGRLAHTGGHYLSFLGSGDRWIKGSTNIPENLLGYSGFDNTPNARHGFGPHYGDWNPGDPDWGGGAGRGIVGLLNYVAQTGANGVYFLPMNIGGDGNDTFPTVSEYDKTHYDVSKLAQWEAVFAHATALGVFLHFQLAETESGNENYHDGGTLGVERKLYYRELVARFGHHLGLEWDLGEENDYGPTRQAEFAAWIASLDPYDHPIANHSNLDQTESTYAPLLGNPSFSMTAIQVSDWTFREGDLISEWRQRSADSGVPWVISLDESNSVENDPFDEGRGYPHGRRSVMWPTYLSGGGGFEWYVQEDGGGHTFDARVENLRELDAALRWTGHALAFLDTLPFWLMEPRPALGSSSWGGRTYVMARSGDSYAVYHPSGGSLSLDLRGDSGTFDVQWFEPQTGNWSSGGQVTGGDWVALGSSPFSGDAAARVQRSGGSSGGEDPPPEESPSDPPPTDPAPEIVVQVSSFPQRQESRRLDAGAVSGGIYAFLDPSIESTRVHFFLDDPRFRGRPFRKETTAPFDLAGGTPGQATPFDTGTLTNGWHTLDVAVLLSDGRVATESIPFLVDNGGS